MTTDNLQFIQDTSTFIQDNCNLFAQNASNFREIMDLVSCVSLEYKTSFKVLISMVTSLTEKCGELNKRLAMAEGINEACEDEIVSSEDLD